MWDLFPTQRNQKWGRERLCSGKGSVEAGFFLGGSPAAPLYPPIQSWGGVGRSPARDAARAEELTASRGSG